ncbi:aminomethyl-transferring glycine dehydrogenase [Corynebacterium sp. 320]|uniref:aminomethyl-transferring glycine dehydrogenase n=1 Tax=Corynebacterium TaxID=1716 RepID=UPI00125CD27B|nr:MULTISPECIES: aminomethyl-transferring glycine dehydrogenase [Corynebacterium]KAB1503118.1 aminomethyl-transferring glycine dehydrogenase [Corynebacterium sp. 320]KAB1551030.1 aminomethyl-transferring glycine dehydrogenase [Corynebacterium sp. 319]KAB3526915.1 aminomethyl-transferring glycine dehydrogenase [Corynebacterium sp. 250]KAB3538408.1 aminomethyl-transferring glycine dehydrogenase [Corynebacterium sp. 366]QNP92471.1 aminomethyl-transferring glycine dehydrogenase [Corynebacterium zh
MATSHDEFTNRHIGPNPADTQEILNFLGYESSQALAEAALPDSIKQSAPIGLPDALDETETLAALRAFADKNVQKKQLIGAGYYDTVTPAVIRRNVVENPGWYTAYTPYQPEISQGRLEALLNFQTMIQDLTGLPIAGASLLDEATAVAEAVQLMARGNAKAFKNGGVVLLDSALHQQSITVTLARAEAAGIAVEVADFSDDDANTSRSFADHDNLVGVVLSNPGSTGRVRDLKPVIAAAKEAGALVTVAADLLASVLVTSPGEAGADIAVGSAQRFGVPLFFGGPHAGFISCTEALQRKLPGRIVGVSVDAEGAPAYRLALQTREQHIRRDKATSNICTAQALLAVVAGFYAVWHGPRGLREIATAVHGRAVALAVALSEAGLTVAHDTFFDTVTVRHDSVDEVLTRAADAGFNLRRVNDEFVGVSVGESTTDQDTAELVEILSGTSARINTADFTADNGPLAEAGVLREDEILTHPIFNSITSETQMMRYLRKLADRDLALDRTMIPLGSCTMKLNAAVSMEPITWPGFAGIHPHVPAEQAQGWLELIADLEERLAKITGYAKVSVQPNAGSQGEFAGLLAIARYHQSRGDDERNLILIPASAHGTNAASAALAGLKVVAVKNAEDGSIDVDDLDAKIAKHGENIAGIMITYPSTHGVFEEQVREVCSKVHAAGGQVYIDGANLNALVGLAQPGEFGGDVSHLNLHKTFTIPHGGGGPGVGPVCVAEHLIPFLPTDAREDIHDDAHGAATGQPVSASAYGSAGVLPITWSYIALMGDEGLTEASRMALVNANYVSRKLEEYYPTLYTGETGLVAHECILDLRELTKASGITAEDVSKRLMDYGFHAPTLAFPVPGTLMVEPTESEDKAELDRFIEAMVSIHGEIQEVIDGAVAAEDSVLRHAPFTAHSVIRGDFDEAVSGGKFTREQAAFPVPSLRVDKYFAPVRRIDGAYGDRNLVCSCPPIEDIAENL